MKPNRSSTFDVLGSRLAETNQQLSVSGYWPRIITYDPPQTIAAALLYRNWSVANPLCRAQTP